MREFFYLGGAAAILLLLLHIYLDVWIYRETKSVDAVLSAWASRYSKNNEELSQGQLKLQRGIIFLEKVLVVFCILLLLRKIF
ncbi:hypothetical protein [Gallionella capsiferriformans]|uniref:Uncharacterized protein n=1 Tax=Gallionella capsiferriformans (strain ES-2) TaxID=395494 RepID=D9SG13_GALCS|nr:hypothetical protein [Gallionella capsiferriformans]ADL55460.1 hypothetical protein Galf_1440 [Gallionella capsiferriformans ES-2]